MADIYREWMVLAAALAIVIIYPDGIFDTLHFVIYALLLINLLLGLSVSLSWVSTSASFKLTEAIGTALCRPLAVMAQLKVEAEFLCDSAPIVGRCNTGQGKGASGGEKYAPSWMKKALVASLLGSGYLIDSTSLASLLVYVMFCALYGANSVMESWDELKVYFKTRSRSEVATAIVLGLAVVVFVVWASPGFAQVTLTFVYCALCDDLYLKRLNNLDLGWLHDDVSGQERILATGVLLLCETVLSTSAIISGIYHGHCLSLVAVLFTVYLPLRRLHHDVINPLHMSRRKLAGFQVASRRQIVAYNDVCAICLCVMRTGRRTPCTHIFHGKCLRRSLEEKKICPLCAMDLTSVANWAGPSVKNMVSS